VLMLPHRWRHIENVSGFPRDAPTCISV
jgi:hypothetical protein